MVPVTTNQNILKNHENDIRCVHFTYVFWVKMTLLSPYCNRAPGPGGWPTDPGSSDVTRATQTRCGSWGSRLKKRSEVSQVTTVTGIDHRWQLIFSYFFWFQGWRAARVYDPNCQVMSGFTSTCVQFKDLNHLRPESMWCSTTHEHYECREPNN